MVFDALDMDVESILSPEVDDAGVYVPGSRIHTSMAEVRLWMYEVCVTFIGSSACVASKCGLRL